MGKVRLPYQSRSNPRVEKSENPYFLNLASSRVVQSCSYLLGSCSRHILCIIATKRPLPHPHDVFSHFFHPGITWHDYAIVCTHGHESGNNGNSRWKSEVLTARNLLRPVGWPPNFVCLLRTRVPSIPSVSARSDKFPRFFSGICSFGYPQVPKWLNNSLTIIVKSISESWFSTPKPPQTMSCRMPTKWPIETLCACRTRIPSIPVGTNTVRHVSFFV